MAKEKTKDCVEVDDKYKLRDGKNVLIQHEPAPPKSPAGCITVGVVFFLILVMCWFYSQIPSAISLTLI